MSQDPSPSGPASAERAPKGAGPWSSAPPSSRRSAARRVGVHACVFWLGGQRFALDTVDVVEVVTLTQLVPVPLSPPWLLGLSSLRGTPLPVVELPFVLSLPSPEPPADAGGRPALVLRVDEVLLASRVDRIEAVYAFEGARFESAGPGEPPAVRGLLEVGRGSGPATLLDHDELARRVDELRSRTRWNPGEGGERTHVATA